MSDLWDRMGVGMVIFIVAILIGGMIGAFDGFDGPDPPQRFYRLYGCEIPCTIRGTTEDVQWTITWQWALDPEDN